MIIRAALLALLVCLTGTAVAQEHHHAGRTPAIDRFYSTWFRPDMPQSSCCNTIDCYVPSEIKLENGQWWFVRREDQAWILIPKAKIEINRDSPDGFSHVCAPPPGERSDGQSVFCFIVGGGT